jgi:hypothetical protein
LHITSLESYGKWHDWIRTSDLFRVNRILNRNSLILGASAAPISIQRHPKSTFSTIVSTIKTQKEKVWEKVWRTHLSLLPATAPVPSH